MPITEDNFTFICKQRWYDLERTNDPTLRFCDRCQKYVHFISDRLDFDRYAANSQCVAVDIEPRSPNREYIVGGIEPTGYPSISRSISFTFDFGSIAALSKSQSDTIYWCKHLGARIERKKKNQIAFSIELFIPEAFDRLVDILEKERIEYSIV